MRRMIFIITLFINGVVNSQSLYNVDLLDSTYKMLYVAYTNKVELVGVPYSEHYRAVSSVGHISKIFYEGDRCFFYVQFNMGPNEIVLEVLDSNELIFKDTFKTEYIRTPKLNFADVNDTLITIREIKKNPFFVIEWETLLKAKGRVESYEITILKHGSRQKFEIKGPLLPVYLIKMISKLKKGDRILFENVRLWVGDSYRIYTFPFTFKA